MNPAPRLFDYLTPCAWLLLLVAIADWIALRRGLLRHSPTLLAILVGGVILLLVLRLTRLVWLLTRRRATRGPRLAELALTAGVLLSLTAGSANWLLRLQGTVILNEQETVRLHGGGDLQVFEAGALARVEEMGVSLALEELELVEAGPEAFYPASHLAVWREPEPPTRLRVTPRTRGEDGPLRFHQGAFGFAPRIVLLRQGETLFDRVVPFLSERREGGTLSFDGRFTLEREEMVIEGSILLDSLDEAMRGHATLAASVSRDGRLLGRGTLLPGRFADIEEGYRIGFAGLDRWSEIVVSRRNYGRFVLAGAALALVGGLAWPIALWRRP